MTLCKAIALSLANECKINILIQYKSIALSEAKENEKSTFQCTSRVNFWS